MDISKFENVQIETEIRGNDLVLAFIFPLGNSTMQEDDWKAPSETAKKLEISTKTLARWAKQFEFPHNGKEGKARRYDYSGVCRALRQHGKSVEEG